MTLLDESDPNDVVELRPVFDQNPPANRGVRSRKCSLGDAKYVEAQSRRMMIPPAALTSLLRNERAILDNSLADDIDRKTAFKTWLGLRYDRPAVPPEYVDLASRIADEVERHGKVHTAMARDILVQFEPHDPPIYVLCAIIIDMGNKDEVTKWLSEAALRVPSELGVLGGVEVRTDADASLRLIERSFGVDLTQITWGGKSVRGEPGRLSHPVQSSS